MAITVHLPTTDASLTDSVTHDRGKAFYIRDGHLYVQEDMYADEAAYTVAAYAPGMWVRARRDGC
jgi:hypothetical protein